MKKKFSLLLLALVLVVAMSIPAFAKTTVKELDDGKFKVTFTYGGNLDAEEVYLAGNFPGDKVFGDGAENNWNASHPDWQMEMKNGKWSITKTLAKGTYAYKFVVNGSDWVKDSQASMFEGDGYGGQNSVVKAGSNKLKGEVKVSGKVINKLEYNDTDSSEDPVRMNNDIQIMADGTMYDEVKEKKIDRLDYSAQINLEVDADDLTDIENGAIETLTPDTAELYEAEFTLLTDPADYTLQINGKDLTNSYDSLGLLDAITGNEPRKNGTTNPNDLVKSGNYTRRFKVEGNTDDVLDYNMAVTEYLDNTTLYLKDKESSDVYLGYANMEKDFSLGDRKVTVGSHLQFNQDTTGKLTDTESVFVESEVIDNLTLKGQYTALSTKKMKEGSAWTIEVRIPELEAADGAENKPMPEVGEVEEMHLVGTMQDPTWTPSDKSFPLTKVADGVWRITSSKLKEGDTFKILWDSDSWDDSHEITASNETNGDNITLNSSSSYAEAGDFLYDRGSSLFAEANYKIVDQEASMQARIKAGDYSITKYKGEFTAGVRTMEQNAYLPVAKDSIMEDSQSGYQTAYVEGEYNVLDNLIVDGEVEYRTATGDLAVDDGEDIEDGDALNEKVKLGADWANPINGLDYVKGHIDVDPQDTNDFDGEQQEVFAEAQTSIIPFLKTLKGNTTQRLDSEISKYYVETELDIPVKQVAHVKGNMTYADDPVTGFEDDKATRIWVEGKLHKLPGIQDYITHVLVNYEMDDNKENGEGLVDDVNYGDDGNDWKNKLYAETKFQMPNVDNWDGVTTKLEFQEVEDGNVDYVPENINKDDQFYLGDSKEFVEWYSFMTFKTGYDLPYDFRSDLTVKYDMNHGEISEYEDDAILAKVTKKFNDRTSLEVSYNKQDGDEGEDYSKVLLETIF